MNFLVSLIPTLFVLGILIIIHEFGHFIVCRLVGVKVEKFSIGFGPEIFRLQGKETQYVISLFPLGGFVKPAGESLSEIQSPSGPRPGDYLAAPLPARIAIVTAGVLMNYVLAYVLFIAVFMIGRPVPGTVIGNFVKGYPAEQSELRLGDRIAVVQGEEVRTWFDMLAALDKAPAGPIILGIEREGEVLNVPFTPKAEKVKDIFGKEHEMKRLGIQPHPEAVEFERYGFLEAALHALETEVQLTLMTYKAIFYLLSGKISMKAMSGPIGIIAMTGDAARMGLPYVLHLTATLSVSLAVFNLFPFPALDGGHLLFLLIEGVRRKSVSLEVQERAAQVGFVLLLALMGFIIYNDLVNLNIFDKVKQLF